MLGLLPGRLVVRTHLLQRNLGGACVSVSEAYCELNRVDLEGNWYRGSSTVL